MSANQERKKLLAVGAAFIVMMCAPMIIIHYFSDKKPQVQFDKHVRGKVYLPVLTAKNKIEQVELGVFVGEISKDQKTGLTTWTDDIGNKKLTYANPIFEPQKQIKTVKK